MKIICANWKFNRNLRKEKKALDFLLKLEKKLKSIKDVEVKIFAHFLVLEKLAKKAKKVKIGAQDLHWEEDGSFTGALLSAQDLISIGIKEVLIGHSETRFYFGVDDRKLSLKLKAAFQNRILPTICIGEDIEDKKRGETAEVIKSQIEEGILPILRKFKIPDDSFLIAYEPIYAISGFAKLKGKISQPAELKDIEFAHQTIKEIFSKENYKVKILYGGSCNPKNARELLSQKFIDGLLVGSASLEFNSFFDIIKIAKDF